MSELDKIIEDLGGIQKITASILANLRWVIKSFEVCDYRGSSASRKITGQWAAAYPETTGYLIPTLVSAAEAFPQLGLIDIATKQLSYYVDLQNPDGSFPSQAKGSPPYVFDTAQILLGLISLASIVTPSDQALLLIRKTKNWLQNQLSHEGNFQDHNFVSGYNPSYYSRIAWPLATAEVIIDSKVSPGTKQFIKLLSDRQTDALSFVDWSLYPNKLALTHNIAYTLRGLWECGELLNDKKLKKKVIYSLSKLSEVIQQHKQVAGRYDENWQGDYTFQCSTGNAQLALLYLLVFERTKKVSFLAIVSLLLKPLIAAQRRFSLNNGAIPSSIPVWGRYQRFQFSNWTQKFYIDALSKLLSLNDYVGR